YSVTASAEGFNGQTVDGVLVEHNLSTTVNFTLQETSSDENRFPVVSTALDGNHPNPFNPETTINYSVKQPGPVKLAVYNIKGQLIRTLVDEGRATGRYKLIFDGRDDRGRSISSGVYLLRMLAPGYQKTRKLMLMK
ncbi:MAG: T9SS type A sorting domain-containing protein, partial [Candidatus Cloacimonadaceae bacterium]